MLSHVIGNKCPNILFILTDQQRHDAVGYTNNVVQTPYLDKLASRSVRCLTAYTQSPQCQPSRASLLTGRYPTAHRVWWNGVPLPLTETTIANCLNAIGYSTAYFGKAHVTQIVDTDAQAMRHFGFQHFYLYQDWVTSDVGILGRSEYYAAMSDQMWTGRFTRRDIHHEDVITQKAVDFIQQARSPYFAIVSYVGPHPPYAAPPPFCDQYNVDDMSVNAKSINIGRWRELKAQYYGCVSWIDDNIGILLNHITDDTLVIFTSDHGDILGDHGLFSKGVYAYEGNTRVPLLFYHQSLPSMTYKHLVQLIDIMPTVLDWAGCQRPPSIQGKTLSLALLDDRPVNEYVLSMIGYENRLRMIRTGRYKYWWSDISEHLYDLQIDPDELCTATDTQLLTEMRFALMRALVAAEDPLPVAPKV